MENKMFGNELFDHWLNQKSHEILAKVEKEKISTEDMLILSLKAQTNHFHHMDQEFRGEFRKIDSRFELADKKFDRIATIMMWGFGLLFTAQLGVLAKLIA